MPAAADAPEDLIVIEVPAGDLARCLATLAMVMGSPLDGASLQKARITAPGGGPSATCVVKQ